MYISSVVLKKTPQLYFNNNYAVIENLKKELYSEKTELKDEHLPNYLIVNMTTGAVEFASDQLPAAIQVAMKLEDELVTELEFKNGATSQ